ncbi:MAG: hypothetical protein VX077_01045, partial [Pseudomonadota bacterium]|nr:hypothetical protein [Pseudomonadota bacterium]
MPANPFRFDLRALPLMVGSLLTLTLVLTGCDSQMVTARFAEAQAQAQSSSGIIMPDELRAALEEALPPADEATRPIPDADEAFLYGVGIGAIQEL